MTETISQNQTVAVIEIGTSAIRMSIAEVSPKMEIRYLENLQKPVLLGKDVFASGRVGRASMTESISILLAFKTVIDSYQVKKVQVIATSAVREALNKDIFCDRVFVRTGWDVEVIEGPEGNRLSLLSVNYALEGKYPLEEKNALFVEIGSGSTEIIILNKGHVEYNRTLAIGTLRLPEQAVIGKTEISVLKRAFKRTIQQVCNQVSQEYDLTSISTMIAMGSDVRFMANQIHPGNHERFVSMPEADFMKYVEKTSKITPEDLVREDGLSYHDAETLYPGLLLYTNFLKSTPASEIVIPFVSIRDGLLLELAQMMSPYKRTDVAKQVIHSAKHLGEKYKYDKNHGLCVASIAVKLFDQMTEEHGLGSRERLLLEVAALLHDIGAYISPSGHHKHSGYLIEAEEIFGLRKSDKDIVSNVVRYHRRSTPKASHVAYMSLAKSDRAVVSKLSAILRVADALDKSRLQKFKTFVLEKAPDQFTIWVSTESGDISLERDMLVEKGDLFGDVFGLPVVIKQGDISPKGGS